MLSALGCNVPKTSPQNLQDKLSLLTKGMHLLSEQIQVKTEELKSVEEPLEPVAHDTELRAIKDIGDIASQRQ